MRNPQGGDEGFAVKACNDGRLASEAFLENDVTIHATSFGQITCGHEAETDKDFCLVCQTFTTTSGGRRNCVKIVHDDPQQPTLPGPCGTFNVINDDLSDSMCSGETEELGQTFSDPHLGFFIEIKTMNAGEEAGGDGQGIDLVLCGGRSWQCDSQPPPPQPPPLATGAVRAGQVEAVIHTPACFVRSGRTYCN
jgi:hypothetical protein